MQKFKVKVGDRPAKTVEVEPITPPSSPAEAPPQPPQLPQAVDVSVWVVCTAQRRGGQDLAIQITLHGCASEAEALTSARAQAVEQHPDAEIASQRARQHTLHVALPQR